MKKALFALLFLVSTLGFAQGTYNNSRFSAIFNGPVTVTTVTHATNTDTNYTSVNGNVEEQVIVRVVDHDIPVDFSSTEFYRDRDASSDEKLMTEVNSNGYYQGHPYSYGDVLGTDNGVSYYRFERSIVVNSRTAIFIRMIRPVNESNNKTAAGAVQEWQDFENTLDIK